LIDMGARLFDPHIGRFLAPDPIVQARAIPDGFNRYAYALNDPASLTDPTGLAWNDRNQASGAGSLFILGVAVGAAIANSGVADKVGGKLARIGRGIRRAFTRTKRVEVKPTPPPASLPSTGLPSEMSVVTADALVEDGQLIQVTFANGFTQTMEPEALAYLMTEVAPAGVPTIPTQDEVSAMTPEEAAQRYRQMEQLWYEDQIKAREYKVMFGPSLTAILYGRNRGRVSLEAAEMASTAEGMLGAHVTGVTKVPDQFGAMRYAADREVAALRTAKPVQGKRPNMVAVWRSPSGEMVVGRSRHTIETFQLKNFLNNFTIKGPAHRGSFEKSSRLPGKNNPCAETACMDGGMRLELEPGGHIMVRNHKNEPAMPCLTCRQALDAFGIILVH
jgi:hypothetical protein